TKCTSASIAPHFAVAAFTIALAASRLEIELDMAKKFECGKSLSWIFGDTPATCAPASRNAFVTDDPSPPFAPVISTTLLLRLIAAVIFSQPAQHGDEAHRRH